MHVLMGMTLLGFWMYLWPEFWLFIAALFITGLILTGIAAILD